MNKARIESTSEIVMANNLSNLHPNYKELIFVCIDEKCSVRMAPSCIKKTGRKKPHFKKYRNREHIETCEYATLSELYQSGRNQKLNQVQVNKVGYPSVFDLNELSEPEPNKLSNAKLDNDEGITGRGEGKKVFEFDADNIKFDRKNKVQSIDRIVDWYLGFPYNRDVEIEIQGNKIPYQFFFKRIDGQTDSATLRNDRIFYGRIMLSDKNKSVFDKYPDEVYINLLAYKDKDLVKHTIHNYSIKIDKKSISKYMLTRLKNKYHSLFHEAYTSFKKDSSDHGKGLYAFVYGNLDETKDTILNVKQHHITFRYDEVRKTMME